MGLESRHIKMIRIKMNMKKKKEKPKLWYDDDLRWMLFWLPFFAIIIIIIIKYYWTTQDQVTTRIRAIIEKDDDNMMIIWMTRLTLLIYSQLSWVFSGFFYHRTCFLPFLRMILILMMNWWIMDFHNLWVIIARLDILLIIFAPGLVLRQAGTFLAANLGDMNV